MKAENYVTFSLVYGSSHVVDHWETADGLQEVIIRPEGSIYGAFSFHEPYYMNI